MRLPGVERRRFLLGAGALAALAGCASPETERIAALTARGIVLTVQFDLGSYALRPEARDVLDPLAAAMNDLRLFNHSYEVNGHTDSTGRLARNMALSDLRAAAVVDYLVAQGVARRRQPPRRGVRDPAAAVTHAA